MLKINGFQFYSANRIAKSAKKKMGWFNFDTSPIKNLKTGQIHKISEEYESVLEDCFDQNIDVGASPENVEYEEIKQPKTIVDEILAFEWNMTEIEDFATKFQEQLQSKWVRFL